jgi:nucleoside-diphosphate-sugar epimerase
MSGKVDILAPYSSQVHANVDVTMQLLKFALDSRAIFFHISTSAVFPPRDNINFKRSCNDLYYDDSMDLLSFSHSLDTFALYGGYYEGYLQSKFVAEMLVWHAIRHQKLMGAVFRPSNVGKKGQVLDGFSYIVKRCIQMKKFPLPPPNVICGFGWISVDALCGFILDMSRKSRDEWNDRAYHLQSADLGLQKLLSHFQNVNRITLNEWTGLPPLLWLDYAIPLNKSVDYDENSKHRHHRGCQIHNEEKFARERKIEAIFKTVPSAIDGVLGYCELPMNSSQAFLDSPHVNNEIKMFLDCYT